MMGALFAVNDEKRSSRLIAEIDAMKAFTRSVSPDLELRRIEIPPTFDQFGIWFERACCCCFVA
jgi:hypothetical protein